MAATDSGSRISTMRLILVPSIITLGVTILRVVGELQHWPKVLFNPEPGGPLAIVGISWLPLIFGPYFALKLTGAGTGPASTGRAINAALLGILVFAVGGILVGSSQFRSMGKVAGGFLVMAAAAAIQLPRWRTLAKTLLAYGCFARIPVAILMFFAMQGNWGTHYDVAPPDFPAMGLLQKYVLLGFLPQMVLWIGFTVILGSLFGAIVVAEARG